MICGDDVVEQFAIAPLHCKEQENTKKHKDVKTQWQQPNAKSSTPKAQRLTHISSLLSAPLPTTPKMPKAKSLTPGKSPTTKAKRQKPNAAGLGENIKTQDKNQTSKDQRQKTRAKKPNAKPQTRKPART